MERKMLLHVSSESKFSIFICFSVKLFYSNYWFDWVEILNGPSYSQGAQPKNFIITLALIGQSINLAKLIGGAGCILF